MKLLRETIRRIILESKMHTLDDLPAGVVVAIKPKTNGYSIYYADANNVQREPNYPKGYLEIDRPNSDTGPCDNAYLLNQLKADNRWGPLLCDIAIEFSTKIANGLALDRYYISEEAESMWRYYIDNKRYGVEAYQLDDLYNTLTPQDTDNCEHDNVATDLMGDIDFESPLTKRYTKTPITLENLGNKLVIL